MGTLDLLSPWGFPGADLKSHFLLMSSAQSISPIPPPLILDGSHQALCLESRLSDLQLYHFQVESERYTSLEVLQVFERYPGLPGVVLEERSHFLGMLSRQRLLEFLMRPQAPEIFIHQPLSVLYSYARDPGLVIPGTTSVLAAAQLALRRPVAQHGEPIVVVREDAPSQFTYFLLDSHELNVAYWQIRGIETQVRYERSQLQMMQTEKMARLGRLVDGVAHEILDPVGFIWGNLVHLSEYTGQVMELLNAYENYVTNVPLHISHLCAEIELDYLRDDIPQTIASIRAGAERLKNLATSLQNFCHIDDVYPKPADLHHCLDSILLLLKSHLTGEIEIIRNYGHLPPVDCYVGQLHQVFMNLLLNAADGLMDQVVRQNIAEGLGNQAPQISPNCNHKPQIVITTQVRSFPASFHAVNPTLRWVSISIADNRPGFSPEKCQQILENFSVEKRANKETSLAMSYQIITARHGGKFYFRSPALSISTSNAAYAGAEFEILLPLA